MCQNGSLRFTYLTTRALFSVRRRVQIPIVRNYLWVPVWEYILPVVSYIQFTEWPAPDNILPEIALQILRLSKPDSAHFRKDFQYWLVSKKKNISGHNVPRSIAMSMGRGLPSLGFIYRHPQKEAERHDNLSGGAPHKVCLSNPWDQVGRRVRSQYSGSEDSDIGDDGPADEQPASPLDSSLLVRPPPAIPPVTSRSLHLRQTSSHANSILRAIHNLFKEWSGFYSPICRQPNRAPDPLHLGMHTRTSSRSIIYRFPPAMTIPIRTTEGRPRRRP
ncbi:hypothetical protein K440DRAFT_641718 [Wilcoxina mikolae CBS 423.85]|nr:hypothetical protein K440DRAFT_641718 [Wilcoxina mikolae CBS 423.85]